MFGCCEIPLRSFFTGVELEIVGMIELEAYRGIEGIEDDQEVVDDIPQADKHQQQLPQQPAIAFPLVPYQFKYMFNHLLRVLRISIHSTHL